MKKVAFSIFLLASLSLLACWFSTDRINGYIAGVNYFQQHVTPKVIEDRSGNVTNNMQVSLPLTVWFKVEPRTVKVDGVDVSYKINRTLLYYKIIPAGQSDSNTSSKWRLAREIDMTGVGYDLEFDKTVKLLGVKALSKELIVKNGDTINAGDSIILVWFLQDNSSSAATNGPAITPGSNLPHITVGSTDPVDTAYGDGPVSVYTNYSAPYVIKVQYNGMTTVGR